MPAKKAGLPSVTIVNVTFGGAAFLLLQSRAAVFPLDCTKDNVMNMDTSNNPKLPITWGLVLAAALGIFSTGAFAAKNENPGVIPPQANAYGKSYGEWSAEWWKWAFSLPVDQNPFFDETGCANGANGQSGQVWFLTGVINESGSAERECDVPVGKALFFPVLNAECSTLEGNGETEEALRACANDLIASVSKVHAKIDGKPVALARYRAGSPLFEFGPLPENNVLQLFGYDAPAGSISASVADGYYLMLAPLSKGVHTLEFGGAVGDPPSFTLDITYTLNVKNIK